jgi:hypothetical protein
MMSISDAEAVGGTSGPEAMMGSKGALNGSQRGGRPIKQKL